MLPLELALRSGTVALLLLTGIVILRDRRRRDTGPLGGLLALSVYVIFKYLDVPSGSMIVGLCALAAAAIVASVYEILHPVD